MLRALLVLCLLAVITACTAHLFGDFLPEAPPAGTIDDAFAGGAGFVAVSPSTGANSAEDALVQSDGKIVLFGESTQSAVSVLTLIRLNADGTLDSSFGSNGVVTHDFGLGNFQAYRIIRDAQGGYLTTGAAIAGGSATTAILSRFSSTGALDTLFGSGGVVTFSAGTNTASTIDLTLQTDAKILVTAIITNTSDLQLRRFSSSGTPDSGFGTAGVVTLTPNGTDVLLGSAYYDGTANAIYAAGHGNTPGAYYARLVEALSAVDGSVITGFGGYGNGMGYASLTTANAFGHHLLRDSQRRFVLDSCSGAAGALISRLTTSGAPDTSFGGGAGYVVATHPSYLTAGCVPPAPQIPVALQSDDKLVFGTLVTISGTTHVAVGRLLTSGAMDTAFADQGWQITNTSGSAETNPLVLIQPDGKILVLRTRDAELQLQRLTTTGAYDSSFASTSEVATIGNDFGGTGFSFLQGGNGQAFGFDENVQLVTVNGNPKLYAFGNRADSGGGHSWVVVRVNL